MKTAAFAALCLLSACANKDWYIDLHAHPEIPVDLTIGRGKADTVKSISTHDSRD